MIEASIVDPANVVRTPLQNAGSVAGLIIITEGTIVDAPTRDGSPGAGGGTINGMVH